MDITDISSEDEYETETAPSEQEEQELEPCGYGQSDTEDDVDRFEDNDRRHELEKSDTDKIHDDNGAGAEEIVDLRLLDGTEIRSLTCCLACSRRNGNKSLVECLRGAKTCRHRGPRLRHLHDIKKPQLGQCLAALHPKQPLTPLVEEDSTTLLRGCTDEVLQWHDANMNLRWASLRVYTSLLYSVP